ncbi:cell division protein FtsA [bacterium]|nr:cell division protein FtsA [bacterium]
MKKINRIVGLDIGTTKVCAIIAEISAEGPPKIVGIGNATSEGLFQGVVVNLESTIKSVRKAVEEAQLMSATTVTDVYLGIAGEHIKSLNSKGVVAISNSDGEITKIDVERVIDSAKAIKLPTDRQIIHAIPQKYIVDEQKGIKDPIGMSGSRLEAEVHLVTGAITYVKNLAKGVEKAGLNVKGFILQPLASSYATLSEDEKKLGVVVLDIGGGTTDIAIFTDESIRFTGSVAIAGEMVTQDISKVFGISYEQAEIAKRKHGVADKTTVSEKDFIEIPGLNNRPTKKISLYELSSVIEARIKELFQHSLEQMQRSPDFDHLHAGLVLTGGGSILPGIENVAREVFEMEVVKGLPQKFVGLSDVAKSPVFATGVGLVLYGSELERNGISFWEQEEEKKPVAITPEKEKTVTETQKPVPPKPEGETKTEDGESFEKISDESFIDKIIRYLKYFF